MKNVFCFAIAIGMMGCTPNQASSTHGALQADPTARSFGIASYVVEGDNVRMIDPYGMELGSLSVRDLAADRRVVDVALADGLTDEIEIYRPMSDGRFVAPIARDFVAGAALSDAALAPLLDRHNVVFRIETTETTRTSGLGEDAVATTTSCDSPSSDTPLGCARPANTSVGCSNPSQLPAAITNDNHADFGQTGVPGMSLQSACLNNGASYCSGTYGGTINDWLYNVPGAVTCVGSTPNIYSHCTPRHTINQWIASCPRSTCGTVGQYDSVPRIRDCYDPGSCTKYQGTVGCTAYH